MKVDDCYQLGYVIKTHGLKGEVQLFLDVDDPLEYREMESMLVYQNNSLIPFFLEYIQINSKKAIAKFEEFDSIDEAKTLVSAKLYLPLNNLPSLDSDQYYLHQLVGMDLYDEDKLIGTVKEWFEMGAQDLISVDHNKLEILVPVTDEIILKVDIEANKIHTKLPEGLIDVYLEDDEN